MNWHDIFEYRDGLLIRKVKVANVSKVGEVAGRVDKFGYVILKYRQKAYRCHRVVWEMHNGAIPKGMYIDHINQNRSDNRIENLMLVSNKENSNNRSLSSRNKSGINGVSWCKRENRWLVQAREFGETVFICYKDTIEEAALARSQYDKLNGYHENHGSENKGYLNTRA